MKRLILMRHGKAGWDHPELADFERPLTRRGERDVPVMGERLRERGVNPDRLISSGAERALRTAVLMSRALRYPEREIDRAEGIYEAGPDYLVRLVRGLNDDYSQVLLVGHNPAFSELGDYLSDGGAEHLRPAGVLCFDFDVPSWRDVDVANAELIFQDNPRH